MSLRDAMRKLRVELGMTQKELAEIMGVNSLSVSRWETGKTFPKVQVANKMIARVREMDISDDCRDDFIQSLDVTRRLGVSASEYGFPQIDQDLLCQVVDGSANAVYVIEKDTYRLLYVNHATEKAALSEYKEALRLKCYEYMRKQDHPCEDCPLKHLVGYEIGEVIQPAFEGSGYILARARKLKWNNKEIYITYVTDVSELLEKYRAAKEQ